MTEGIPSKESVPSSPRFRLAEGQVMPAQHSAEACAREIAAMEEQMTQFENTHNLRELYAIPGFNSIEERLASVREPAKVALNPIVSYLNYVRFQTAVSDEKYYQLERRYRILSRAVGMLRADPSGERFEIVVHDR